MLRHGKLISLAIILFVLAGCEQSGKMTEKHTGLKEGGVPQIQVEELSLAQVENRDTAQKFMKRLYETTEEWQGAPCPLGVSEVEMGEDSWEVYTYCMKPVSLKRVTVGAESRLYFQTAGENKESVDYFWGVGFLILDEKTDKIIAKASVLPFQMPPRRGPAALDFVQLSSTGYFGWMGVATDVDFHKKTMAKPAVYAPKGKEVVLVTGNLPESGDIKRLKYHYLPDTSNQTVSVYPLSITETNVSTGKKRTFTANFDRKKWEYHCNDKRCRYEYEDSPADDGE